MGIQMKKKRAIRENIIYAICFCFLGQLSIQKPGQMRLLRPESASPGLENSSSFSAAPGLAVNPLPQRKKNLKTLREGDFTVSPGVLFHGPISPYSQEVVPWSDLWLLCCIRPC